MAERALAGSLAQAGQARLAAAIAASVSVPPRLATWASRAPVAGSVTSKTWPLPFHWPSMRAWVLSSVGSWSLDRGDVGMVVTARGGGVPGGGRKAKRTF